MIKIAWFFQILFHADKHMGEIRPFNFTFEFQKISAYTTGYACLCHNMPNKICIRVTYFHTFKLFHVNIYGHMKLLRIPYRQSRLPVHHFLRNRKLKPAAFSKLALYRHKTTHFVDDCLGNCKSQTDSPLLTISFAVNLTENRKNLLDMLFSHSNTGIFHRNRKIDTIVLFPIGYADTDSALLCKFDGITDQVHDYTADFLFISHHDRRKCRVHLKHQFNRLICLLCGTHMNHIIGQ